MAGPVDLSRAELRRALRVLRRERRPALGRAVREGRAADDPRDAVLAVALARRIQATPWPQWALPRTRPRGWRALLWSAHAAWLLVVIIVVVVVPAWRPGGLLRWIVVAALAYGLVSVPFSLAFVFRARWNAPEAERLNRELLASSGER